MRLTDHAVTLRLRPLGYQFPAVNGDRFDDNWLIAAGEVTTPDGAWSFADPCLLVDEAREVSWWLRAVAAGRIEDTQPGPDGEVAPGLSFLEPDLAFSQVEWHGGGGVLRVHLSLAGLPPWHRHDENLDSYEYGIEIATDRDALLRAAADWERLLLPFPPR